jgi:hypothetical protein
MIKAAVFMMHLLGLRASRRRRLCVKEDFRARSLFPPFLYDPTLGSPLAFFSHRTSLPSLWRRSNPPKFASIFSPLERMRGVSKTSRK